MADVLSHIDQAFLVEESDIRWSQYDPAHNFISLVLFSLLSAVQFFFSVFSIIGRLEAPTLNYDLTKGFLILVMDKARFCETFEAVFVRTVKNNLTPISTVTPTGGFCYCHILMLFCCTIVNKALYFGAVFQNISTS